MPFAKLFEEHAHSYHVGQIEHELGLPDQVPPVGVNSIELLDNEIGRLDDNLTTVGDDAQLANIDLQNLLQRQQQTFQVMSNLMKTMHDTIMAAIRNIGG